MMVRTRNITNAARAAALAAAGAALLTLAACRAEEQGRGTITLEPGVYKGAADDVIDQETRDQLRSRVRQQNF